MSKSTILVCQNCINVTNNYQGNLGKLWTKLTLIFFHHYFFDNCQFQHRKGRGNKGSSKIVFVINFFQLRGLKTQQRYIFQEVMKISKREITSFIDSLRDCLKNFEKAGKCFEIPLLRPIFENGSTKPKLNLFAQ